MQAYFRADRLREARLRKNMTQEMLAERCNTSDRYIRDLERGRKRHPSAEMVYLLAANLEIAMEQLVDTEQEEGT